MESAATKYKSHSRENRIEHSSIHFIVAMADLRIVLGLLFLALVNSAEARFFEKQIEFVGGLHWPVNDYRQHQLSLDNGLAATPPMGWNSWNHFWCDVNEDVVRQTADALVSTGLAAKGYTYVNLDDCWAEMERDSQGNLQARSRTFPSGIKALADHVHSKGLKFGLYSDAGYFTCAEQPGSLGHEEADAKTFASWEVDYLKYDNCNTDGTKPEVRYPVMRDALIKSGRQIFFSMCEWGEDNPAMWARDVGNSWRTTGDITDKWSSVVGIADSNNVWADYAGPGGWNDPDMLEVGNGGMTTEEYRSHFSVWALMKAPLLIGNDVRNISSEILNILGNEEVIAVNQDSLGKQGKKIRQQGLNGLEIWSGPLSSGRAVLLLWNRSSKTDTITAIPSDIGLRDGTKVTIRDVWEHKDLGKAPFHQITQSVPSHGVKMFVITPV